MRRNGDLICVGHHKAILLTFDGVHRFSITSYSPSGGTEINGICMPAETHFKVLFDLTSGISNSGTIFVHVGSDMVKKK